jgi:hypothetical protein
MSTNSYDQGGDAQAIKRVADAYYGGYRTMFETHGWEERADKMMTSAPRRIVEAYGSIRSFEERHATTDLMFPMEAIRSNPPNVWLTSFYGFRPESWGFLGFTREADRRSFIADSKPGALIVIYGAGEAAKDELGKVIGIQQCSHRTGDAAQFMSPVELARKQADPDRKGRWNHAVKAVRAWRVSPESRMHVRDFAPGATANEAWQHIGARGERLSPQDALNILKLDLQEIDVYGENPVIESAVGTARHILAPSRAGPVSQSPYVVTEAEGPKHLYVLILKGDTDAFLREPRGDRLIVKAGFSRSPESRRDHFNKALPGDTFKWEVLRSGPLSALDPHPTSDHAKAGERAIQAVLTNAQGCRSLGGEFFLATHEAIDTAWADGNAAAKAFNKV